MTDKEQKKIFARNLNNYLAQSGKTQKEVADAINVSPQTFNTWCKGIAIPRMGKVQLLADYFQIGKSDLIENKTIGKDTPLPSNTTSPIQQIFDSLNEEGQDKLIEYGNDLAALPKYKKCDMAAQEEIG